MDSLPRLPDEHLTKARELAASNRKSTNCKRCYNRGYQGVDQDNMLVLCPKCVDVEEVGKLWRDYVRETPALKELYGDYFEDPEEEDAGADENQDQQ
mgnify:CR=1 FL=1